MNYQWQWHLMVEQPYLGWLGTGVKWTLAISLLAYVIALGLGSLVGIARTLDSAVARQCAQLYVTLFRSVPLLVQLFLWYFVVPELLPQSVGHWVKRDLPAPEFWTTAIGLGLFMSARIAEQIRAAIAACAGGLAKAAKSQGFNTWQIYCFVLLPVSLRYALPTLVSEMLNTIKNSSLAMTIGMLELTGQSRQIEAYTFKGLEAFTVATAIYVLMSLMVILIGRVLEQRFELPGMLRNGGNA